MRERRGETISQAEPSRIAALLEYAGGAIVAIGIVFLVVDWTVTPGQS